MINIPTSPANGQNMWRLMETLFPMHRSLIGPGFAASLEKLRESLPLEIHKFPSGTKVFDWTIPKGFKVNEAYVEAPDGTRPIDFEKNHCHVWSHSAPFFGEMDLEELVENIAVHPVLSDAIPQRASYYREKWGVSASQNQVNDLQPGRYKVNIDTELIDDFLRIGEFYLPGETEDEIIIPTYLCHPHGANDNLSGVVVAIELFKLLQKVENRRFSYRLLIWPETIGSITYISQFPERLKNVVGGIMLAICGDPGPFELKKSFDGNSFMDKAAKHALAHSGKEHKILDYEQSGADERQFNAPGLRLPMIRLARSFEYYPEYHSSSDDLTVVTQDALLDTLNMYCKTIEVIERDRVYKPTFTVEPFLSGHGIYPYDLGAGEGSISNRIAQAYYDLSGWIDGQHSLLDIADALDVPIEILDRPVRDMLKTGLIEEVSPPSP